MPEWTLLVQAVIAMIMITAPPDPVKILLFNTTIERQGLHRVTAALRVAVVVLVILAGAALVGRPLLELMGINVYAFGAVGGLIIFGMGIEMLYEGAPSRTQGGAIEAEAAEGGPPDDMGLIIPLSTPLIAGPGAIVTVITISSTTNGFDSNLAAIVGAAAVAVVVFISFAWLGDLIARLSPTATALLVRIGGLLLATIGAQMLLGSLLRFLAT